MSKSHRDNHKARLKRGPEAFDKKAKRRSSDKATCPACGRKVRAEKMIHGQCPICAGREWE